jgi:hypothetical protein
MRDISSTNPSSSNRLQLALIPIAALALIGASVYVLSSGRGVEPSHPEQSSVVSVNHSQEPLAAEHANSSPIADVAADSDSVPHVTGAATSASLSDNNVTNAQNDTDESLVETADTTITAQPTPFDASAITNAISPFLSPLMNSSDEAASLDSPSFDDASQPSAPSTNSNTPQDSSITAEPPATSAEAIPNQTPELEVLSSAVAIPTVPASTAPEVKHVDRQLINPSENQYPVHFILNDQQHTLHPGQSLSATDDMPSWTLRYHRGGALGEIEYEISSGIHAFRVSPQGWWTESLVLSP